MHIKRIKGKEYYYESKRIGKKVTSVYIGPVDKVSPKHKQEHKSAFKPEAETSAEEPEEFYVG